MVEVTKQHDVIKPITEGTIDDHRHPHFGTSSQIASLETSRLISPSVRLHLIYLPKIIEYRHELPDKFYACHRAIGTDIIKSAYTSYNALHFKRSDYR
jgi:hypothetical protein